MTRSGDPLTLSREDLYELVWSKPMTELAQDFGLSDVALAKRCRKLGVPIPGRGYWARVAAGQTPRQPALRKRADDVMDYTALTFNAPREETPPEATLATAEQHPLFEKVQSLQLTRSDDLRLSSPAVKRTAARLKRPWRSEIRWNRGERQGPIISIDVTESCADRALKVSEQIIAGASALGWVFKAPPKQEGSRSNRYEVERPDAPVFGCLYVENEALAFRIDERAKRIDHELTADSPFERPVASEAGAHKKGLCPVCRRRCGVGGMKREVAGGFSRRPPRRRLPVTPPHPAPPVARARNHELGE